MNKKELLKRFKGKSHDEIIDIANEITAPIRAKLKLAKTEEEKNPLREESLAIANFAIRVANGAPNGVLYNWPDDKPIPEYMEIVDGWVMPEDVAPFFPGREFLCSGCFYTIEDMYWNLYKHSYDD